MAKDDMSRDISELLEQLRENVSENEQKKPKTTEKTKKMTDEDVKALLKKYYGDSSEQPEEKEPSFVIDTSDFVVDEPDPEPEPEPELEPEPEPEPKPESKPEPQPKYQEFRIDGSSTIYNCDVSRFYQK